jgi:acyl dehydratase
MPIDVDSALGSELPGTIFSWDQDDVILYNLALGAGVPPEDPAELKYAYEGDLVPVPSYATIPPFSMMMSLGEVPGLDLDLSKILHGDQTLTIHRPIPTSGTVSQGGRIVDIYDRGRGALIVLEVSSVLEKTGETLFTNRAGVYVRGEGGFGGDPGPASGSEPPTGRQPDHVVESSTLPQQALLYRMASGDKNPLHADPAFAAFAGFERPILHGLCTYGVVLKAVTESALGGDPTQVGSYYARFTGHVFPGETLVTSIWDSDDGLVLETTTKERGTKVLGSGVVQFRPTSPDDLPT